MDCESHIHICAPQGFESPIIILPPKLDELRSYLPNLKVVDIVGPDEDVFVRVGRSHPILRGRSHKEWIFYGLQERTECNACSSRQGEKVGGSVEVGNPQIVEISSMSGIVAQAFDCFVDFPEGEDVDCLSASETI